MYIVQKGTHQLIFIFDSQGSSGEGRRDIHFLRLLRDVAIDLLPLVDEGSVGGVFWQNAHFLLQIKYVSLSLSHTEIGVTHSCACDLVCNLPEKCLVLLGVLAPDENFKCDLATFQWLQMFCCAELGLDFFGARSAE